MKNRTGEKMRILPLVILIAIPLLAGGFSALLTAGDMNVYETMARPKLAPPGWLFPVVWTILYVLMGFASYHIFTSDAAPEKKRTALLFYMLQLIMNMFWSTLFFTYRRYMISLIWLLIMWALILICVIRFFKIRKAAGLMMGVLFLWTTFAAYLNLMYYILSITPMTIAS